MSEGGQQAGAQPGGEPPATPPAQLSIDDIVPPKVVRRKATSATKKEKQAWENAHLELMAKLDRRSYSQILKQRRKYAFRLFKLISFWLAAVLWIVIAQGWKDGYFKASDKVVLALIGGTTVTVLGLFVIVAKFIFPDPAHTKGKKS